MDDSECVVPVKQLVDEIFCNAYSLVMEKPRLLHILFDVMSKKAFPDYQAALSYPEIKYRYNNNPHVTPSYDLIRDELIETYLGRNPKATQCIFSTLTKERCRQMYQYIDKKIKAIESS